MAMKIANLEDMNAAVKVMLRDLPTFKAAVGRELGISRETIRTATMRNTTVSTLLKICSACGYSVSIKKNDE